MARRPRRDNSHFDDVYGPVDHGARDHAVDDEHLLVELRASGDLGYHREVARRAANRLAELKAEITQVTAERDHAQATIPISCNIPLHRYHEALLAEITAKHKDALAVIKQVRALLVEGMESTGTGTLHYHRMRDAVTLIDGEGS